MTATRKPRLARPARWVTRTFGSFTRTDGHPTAALLPRRETSTRCHPCVWCGEPNRWPNGCSEVPKSARDRCAEMIEFQCGLGDHRRCDASACVVACRWHEPVRRAGVAAARTAGAAWAVVSTIDNGVVVVGTDDDLGRANSLLRATALRQAGIRVGPEGVGPVYVVRGADGALF